MKKQYHLLGCLLFASVICSAQAKYWANNMRLYPLDSCKKNSIQFSIGFGTSTPTMAIRKSLNALETRDLAASLFLPMGQQRAQNNQRISYGLHIGLAYAIGHGNYSVNDLLRSYNISGQRQAPLLTAAGTGEGNNVTLRLEIGPRFNIRAGRILISPTLSWGVVKMQQEGYRVEQTTIAAGVTVLDTTIRFNRYIQAPTNSFGPAFLPSLRLGYTKGRLGYYVEGQYVWGPTVNRDVTVFVPQGAADPVTGNYSINQIRLGTTAGIEGERANYESWGIRAGISFQLRQNCNKRPKKCPCAK